MKHFTTLIFLFSMATASAQNVGINTPSPTSSLDINGGLRLRQENTAVSGTSVMLTSNRAHHVLIGSPTADFTIAFSDATQEGQHLILTNTTAFKGFLVPMSIPASTTLELIYSNGAWKQIGSSEAVTNTAWGLNGNNASLNNFIGTINDAPLLFKTFNNEAGGLGRWGNVTLGTARTNNFFSLASSGSVQNTAIGNAALQNNSVMYANTAVGFGASQNNLTGHSNTALGHSALNSNKNGAYAVAIGKDALLNDTAAEQTVAVGGNALYWNNNRYGNTAVGTNSLFYNSNPDLGVLTASQGIQNTALGHSALFSNRRGSGSVAIGYQAAYSDTAAEGIIAIGRAALYNNKAGKSNIAIGDSALFENNAPYTPQEGSHNIGIGSKALMKNRFQANVAIGTDALRNNNGYQNTAIGNYVMQSCLRCDYNIALGPAMQSSKSGRFNIALGLALSRSDGEYNIALGNQAIFKDLTGNNNIAIGKNTLHETNGGNDNVAIGSGAGYSNTTGNSNVFIGQQSGGVAKSFSKLYIGSYTGFSHSVDSLNTLIYGDFAADSLLLNGKTTIRNNAVVKGFTKLGGYGDEVPAIKTKKIIGYNTPTSANPNTFTYVPHGVTASKILSVSVLVDVIGGYQFLPHSTQTGYLYTVNTDPNGGGAPNIAVGVKTAAESASVMGRPIKIFITYEE